MSVSRCTLSDSPDRPGLWTRPSHATGTERCMAHAVMLVLSNSTTSEQEEDFNRWYTDQHIHDLVKLPGVVAATRYRMMPGIEVVPDVDEPPQKYLAIYELEAETEAELREFATMLQQALGDGRAGVHAALDMTTLGGGFALPLSERVERAVPA